MIYNFLKRLLSAFLFYRNALRNGINVRKTVIVNFRFLPRAQAWKFPIFVYGKMKIEGHGQVVINSPLSKALISIGAPDYLAVSNDPSLFYNYGTIIFNGRFVSSYSITICAHNKIAPATIEFGDNIIMGMKNSFQAFDNIKIGNNVRIAHCTQIYDTNFHYIVDTQTGNVPPMTAPVYIGNNCWIGNHSNIMKGCVLPDGVIVASGSLANKDYREILPTYCVAAGRPIVKKAENKRRIVDCSTEQAIHHYYVNNPNTICQLKDMNAF